MPYMKMLDQRALADNPAHVPMLRPPRVPQMTDIRLELREALVRKVLEQVVAGHWTAREASARLCDMGLEAPVRAVRIGAWLSQTGSRINVMIRSMARVQPAPPIAGPWS